MTTTNGQSGTTVHGAVATMVSIGDLADRAPRALADGEQLTLGKHAVRSADSLGA